MVMNAEDYKKKIALCEKLGATKFQKVVFKVEELKYKFIKKFLPNYTKWLKDFRGLAKWRNLY